MGGLTGRTYIIVQKFALHDKEKIAKPYASPDIGLYRYDNTNSSFPRKRESTTIALGSRFRGSDGWGQWSFAIFS